MNSKYESGVLKHKWLFGVVVVLMVSALLLIFNLSSWPVTWYDEGITLQVARNLTESGRYGIDSSDGFRAFSPIISTGPTVSVPIALVFARAGIGLLQARIVMAIYALLSVLAMYFLALRLFDFRTAVVSSFLLLTVGAASNDTSGSFLGLGRMVMGEVPALAFLLGGTLFWAIGLDSERRIYLIAAGLLWGMALVTKPQFAIILVALVLTWVLQKLFNWHVPLQQFLIPLVASLVCAGIWIGWQYLGSSMAAQAEVTARLGTQLAVLSPQLIIKSSRVLLLQREIVWGLPGIVYGFHLAITSRHPKRVLPSVLLTVICLLWLSWFVLGSVGWGRYIFIPMGVMALFSAKLLVDLVGCLQMRNLPSLAKDFLVRDKRLVVQGAAVVFAFLLMLVGSLQSPVRNMIVTRDDAAFAFAQYLDQNLPAGAVVECFETELIFLSQGDFRFHQPPFAVESLAIRHTQLDVPYENGSYDFREYDVTHLVSGPFSKWTEIYDRGLQDVNGVLLKSVGVYDLYQITATEGGGSNDD